MYVCQMVSINPVQIINYYPSSEYSFMINKYLYYTVTVLLMHDHTEL